MHYWVPNDCRLLVAHVMLMGPHKSFMGTQRMLMSIHALFLGIHMIRMGAHTLYVDVHDISRGRPNMGQTSRTFGRPLTASGWPHI